MREDAHRTGTLRHDAELRGRAIGEARRRICETDIEQAAGREQRDVAVGQRVDAAESQQQIAVITRRRGRLTTAGEQGVDGGIAASESRARNVVGVAAGGHELGEEHGQQECALQIRSKRIEAAHARVVALTRHAADGGDEFLQRTAVGGRRCDDAREELHRVQSLADAGEHRDVRAPLRGQRRVDDTPHRGDACENPRSTFRAASTSRRPAPPISICLLPALTS